ncbi:glutamic-type intramembrane protease PrsW [Paenisporosarcina sp. OV554]|uniref:glutamic-type intramembrane protease PrsW n=1 Tax=Paenisporosarcina sp. OV554 TaxID=2135694 RepID=UPI000D36D084|nr:glutamic-type intramembrane protease PrsW [Paenisporosarcina sp. OV554]PUB10351.1 RsiW-degrading membrane proteinase PrsW (M82 family) [Paenisporosarcina sp. OV554]
MIILLSVAIAPGLALFSYFYLRNQISSEPSRSLFHTFIYGAMLTFPILFIQHVFKFEHIFQSAFITNVLFTSTLEEFFKWLILVMVIYQHVDFEDPYDGILYGASVSLGFATVENILYLLTYGLDTAFLRALLPVSSHAIFGVVMGYYLGRAKFAVRQSSKPLLFIALLAPLSLHMIYNGILAIEGIWLYFMIPFMLFLWWLCLTKVKQAHLLTIQHFQTREELRDM